MFLAGGEFDSIKSDRSIIFDFSGTAPLGYINKIITVYDDLFGQPHISVHNMDFNKKFDGLIVFSNEYEELKDHPEKSKIESILLSTHCSADNIVGY